MTHPLTTRQAEIMDLLAAGATNREIAARLYISEATAKGTLQTITQRMDMMGANRTTLAAWWIGLRYTDVINAARAVVTCSPEDRDGWVDDLAKALALVRR